MDDRVRIHAPELAGDVWLNTGRPLRLADLRGKAVLLDFWTSCCINCMHVLPHLARIERKHGDALVVIGVHSAKFASERDPDNLRQAVLRLGIEHPVVSDPEHRIWQAYAVRAWPTLILIDPEGYVVGQVAGEGHHDRVDETIGQVIQEYASRGLLDPTPLELVRETDGDATRGPLAFPGKVLADAVSGRLFVADSGHHRVVVARLDGTVIAVAGDGAAGAADGSFATASFHNPQGMALDGDTLYVADTDNHLIRALDLTARTVATLAGTGRQAEGTGEPGFGRDVALNSPWDLALFTAPAPSPEGEAMRFLFVAMAGSHQIWLVDLARAHAYPFAGSGQEGLCDDVRAEAALAQPSGLTLHRRWLFIADSEVSALRSIDLSTEEVSTVVGQGLFEFGDVDGDWESARFQHPIGVAVDGPTVYVADTYNHKVKAVDLLSSTVRTVAGDGQSGRDDGDPGRLREPGGLSFAGGKLYIADTGNHSVRVLDPDKGSLATLALEGLAAPATPRRYRLGRPG